MNYPARFVAMAWSLAVGLGVCGCSNGSSKSWSSGSGASTIRDDGKLYSFSTAHLGRQGQSYVVLVANGSVGGTFSGGEGKFRGDLMVKDGEKIPWSCETLDGQTGKIVIDGKEFDLTYGGLFLVSTESRPRQVEQVTIRGTRLQTCTDAKQFLVQAKSEPQMARFLLSCVVSE
jgi:hypothetical protein